MKKYRSALAALAAALVLALAAAVGVDLSPETAAELLELFGGATQEN